MKVHRTNVTGKVLGTIKKRMVRNANTSQVNCLQPTVITILMYGVLSENKIQGGLFQMCLQHIRTKPTNRADYNDTRDEGQNDYFLPLFIMRRCKPELAALSFSSVLNVDHCSKSSKAAAFCHTSPR